MAVVRVGGGGFHGDDILFAGYRVPGSRNILLFYTANTHARTFASILRRASLAVRIYIVACPKKEVGFTMSEHEYDGEVAEPFRFNFEIAWEVANKGKTVPYKRLRRALLYVHV